MEESSFYFPEANLEYVIMPWDDNTELIFYEVRLLIFHKSHFSEAL